MRVNNPFHDFGDASPLFANSGDFRCSGQRKKSLFPFIDYLYPCRRFRD